jgi:hypothetical protein
MINLEKKGAISVLNPIGISCPSSKTLVIPYNGVGYNLATADKRNSAEIKILEIKTTFFIIKLFFI